jgi:hypothetical protein
MPNGMKSCDINAGMHAIWQKNSYFGMPFGIFFGMSSNTYFGMISGIEMAYILVYLPVKPNGMPNDMECCDIIHAGDMASRKNKCHVNNTLARY